MTPSTVDTGLVRGDLLSCFGTATAGLLEHLGLPHLVLMGCQLFTATRWDSGVLEFVHQHTPIHDTVPHRLTITRRAAGSPIAAAAGIRDEAARTGAMIVTGASTGLPWLAAAEPAPHWILLTPVPGAADRFTVTDAFRWIDDAGEHLPHTRTCSGEQAARFAAAPPGLSAAVASRDRWALGYRLDPPGDERSPRWLWMQARLRPAAAATGDWIRGEARRLLLRSAHQAPADPAALRAWHRGSAALALARDLLAEHGAELETYAMHNDLWVAARARGLFHRALDHPVVRSVTPGAGELSDWVEHSVLPAWTAVNRAMRYDAGRVARGHAPRGAAVSALDQVIELEQELRRRLGAAVAW